MPTATARDRGVPDAVIASVKNNASFLSLLRTYGLSAAKKGKGYFAVCPFHQVDGGPEKVPSLSIDTVTNLYHCFSCNARGNVIQFVMEMEKVTFPEAVEKLLALKGAGLRKAIKREHEEAAAPTLTDEERQKLLAEVVRRSVEDLRNSEAGGGHTSKPAVLSRCGFLRATRSGSGTAQRATGWTAAKGKSFRLSDL